MDSESGSFSPAEMKRIWRIVTWAGLLGSIYYLICINGAPRIKYLTELRASAFDFGLIAGLGSFALAFQVVGSIVANRMDRRKPFWIVTAIAHRVVFLAVLAAPLLFLSPHFRILWIICVLFLHDALANIGSPIWLSWMADIVPQHSMTQHWGSRQRFITFFNIAAMVAVAFGFGYFETANRVILGFTLLALFGVVVGVADILMFIKVPEPPQDRVRDGKWLTTIIQPIKDRQFRPFLYFTSYWYFSVFLAAPFFGLFMIDDLKMSVRTVQLISIPSALGVVISSHYWGVLCDTYGYRRVLQTLAVGKALAPLWFILAPRSQSVAVPLLWITMFFDGLLNSGVTLAIQGILLRATPRRNRTTYIAAFNFFSMGVMAALAPIVGGKLIDVLSKLGTLDLGIYHLSGFHGVFALSMLLRIGAVPLAARICDVKEVPLDTVWKQLRSLTSYRIAALVSVLHRSQNEKRRLSIVRRLAQLRHPMAIGELVHALQDNSRAVRQSAANALGRIGTADATAPLARALFDQTSDIQPKAARALGRIGGVHSLKALLLNLRRQDTAARLETIDSLAEIGDSAAMVPLICMFHEYEDEQVRRHIAAALAKLGETESLDEVMKALIGDYQVTRSPGSVGLQPVTQ